MTSAQDHCEVWVACGWVVNVAVPVMGVVSHCGSGVAVLVLCLSSPWASVPPLTTIVVNGSWCYEILIIPCRDINTWV